MTLPPFPDQWHDLVIVVTTQPDGTFAGSLSIGSATWHLSGWHKAATGILKGKAQAIRDPAWEAYLDTLGKRIEA